MANRRFIDFPIASTVGDNDIVLIWQDGANKQTTKATILSGLPENLDELNDVVISGLTNGQILRYDSVTGKWLNTDQGNLDLNDLNDVSIVSPSNGQVLVYNSSTSKWENSSGGYVPYTGAVTTVNLGAQTIQSGSFVKAGGTSSQFLKADGSVDSTAYGSGTVTSVGLTMPSAFSVANSPITSSGTLAVTGAGTVGQYIRGDGSLADFPSSSGGGSSVSYYLNGSVNQGTIGGVAYKELNKTPIIGAGTDFTINANGYIAQFLTDAGDPNLLEIPGGNWNFETYFSASSSGGTPTFYVELYKYDGSSFTLIASNSGSPEFIAFGTTLTSYFSTLAVPTTTLALTDRLAIRYYVNHSGRTITLHTEDNHLCQVITTFTTGLTALNGLTAQVQNFAVGTSGTDFNIASATATHTFNLPTATATIRGALSASDWSTFNNKQNALGYTPVPETRTITINGTTQDLSANRTYNVGTVTSVGLSSATSGVTIGSTPVTSSGTITLAIATASGSQNGLLSSTDWTTFNNKQNALTNPITGTGTLNFVPKFTSSLGTIGNSTIQDNGSNITLGLETIVIGNITASNLSGTNTGNVTIGTANGLSLSGQILSLALASGSTTGALSSTDWTTFNNKQNALTNPVTGTGTTNYLPKFTGSTTIGNSQIFDNGNGVSINFTSFPASTYKFQVRQGTNRIFGIAEQEGDLSVEAYNDAVNAGVPLRIYSTKTQILNGNLLVGTTTDNGAKLQVSGAGTFSGSTGTNHVRNTNTATTGFSAASFEMFVHNGSSVAYGGGMFQTNSTFAYQQIAANQTNIYGYQSGGMRLATGNAPIIFATGNSDLDFSVARFTISSTGFVSAGATTNGRLGVRGFTNDSSGYAFEAANASGNTLFITRNDGVSTFIGNVGIGTFSPVSIGGYTALTLNNATTGGILTFQRNGVNNGSIYNDASSNMYFGNNSGNTIFETGGSERMRITSGGNVLIGTTTDVGARLHVNGDVRTAAPTGGSAVNWKLGTVRGGTVTPNATVRVEIGGVLVDLDARYV